MKKILILFAHPKFEQSRVNKALVRNIPNHPGVTFHDLYECYPDFNIDIAHEKKLLESHEVIIWHHPFYWYSAPPIIKQWIDLVLEFGWAYGRGGHALEGKQCMQIITTGGSKGVYQKEGKNHYSINEFLRPFEQTARLCGMDYLSPFAVVGAHKLSGEALKEYVDQYHRIINTLHLGESLESLTDCTFQDDVPNFNNPD